MKRILCLIITLILCLGCAGGAAAAESLPDTDAPDSGEIPQGIMVTLQGPGALYMRAEDGKTWEPVGLSIPYPDEDGTLELRAVSEVADGCGVFVNEAAAAAVPEEDPEEGGEVSAWTFSLDDPAQAEDLFVVFGEQTQGLSPVWVALGTGTGTLEVQNRDGGWEISTDAVYYREVGDSVVVRAIAREEGTIASRFRNNGRLASPSLYGAGYTQYTIQVEENGNGVVVDFASAPLVAASYDFTAGALFIYEDDGLSAVLNGASFPTAQNDLTQCVVYAYEPEEKSLSRVTLDKDMLAWQPIRDEGAAPVNRWEFFMAPKAHGKLELTFSETGTLPPDDPGTVTPPDEPGIPDTPPDIPDHPTDPGTSPDQILIGEGAPVGLEIIVSADGNSQVLTGLTAPTSGGMTVGDLKSCLVAPAEAGIEILTSDGTAAEETDVVATGMQIRAEGPPQSGYAQSIGVVVMADVRGTGLLNITQIVRVAQSVNGSAPLEGLYRMAADFNGDDRILVTDLVQMAKLLVNS